MLIKKAAGLGGKGAPDLGILCCQQGNLESCVRGLGRLNGKAAEPVRSWGSISLGDCYRVGVSTGTHVPRVMW